MLRALVTRGLSILAFAAVVPYANGGPLSADANFGASGPLYSRDIQVRIVASAFQSDFFNALPALDRTPTSDAPVGVASIGVQSAPLSASAGWRLINDTVMTVGGSSVNVQVFSRADLEEAEAAPNPEPTGMVLMCVAATCLGGYWWRSVRRPVCRF